jgi:hypothetical protein
MPLVVVDHVEIYYEMRGPVAVSCGGGLGLEMSELETRIDPLASTFRLVAFEQIAALGVPRNANR